MPRPLEPVPDLRWHFEPPMHLLTIPHVNAGTLGKFGRGISRAMSTSGELSEKHLRPLHPRIRERLPSKPTTTDLSRHLYNIEGARALLDMGLPPTHFVPAVIHAHDPQFIEPYGGATYPVEVQLMHPKVQDKLLKTTADLSELKPWHYIIEAYGMPGSSKRRIDCIRAISSSNNNNFSSVLQPIHHTQ